MRRLRAGRRAVAHGLEVERPAGFASSTVLEKAEEFRPDVVLLDFWLGERDSLDLMAPLAGLGCRVAMFTAMDNPVVLGECLERGPWGPSPRCRASRAWWRPSTTPSRAET